MGQIVKKSIYSCHVYEDGTPYFIFYNFSTGLDKLVGPTSPIAHFFILFLMALFRSSFFLVYTFILFYFHP